MGGAHVVVECPNVMPFKNPSAVSRHNRCTLHMEILRIVNIQIRACVRCSSHQFFKPIHSKSRALGLFGEHEPKHSIL